MTEDARPDNDDAFEPGASSPLDADGRLRWSQAKAAERFAEAQRGAEDFLDWKRRNDAE